MMGRGPSLLWLFVLLAAGCQSSPQSEVSALTARLKLPEGWTPSTEAPDVPGDRVASWSGPDGATLVLYQTLGASDPRPESLARELANRMTNLPEARVLRSEVVETPSGKAALLETVAPGDGSRLAPSGLGTPKLESVPLVPTRQIGIGHLAPTRTLWLVAHYPDAIHDRIGPGLERSLRDWAPDTSASY